jgi:glycosyltransferase involved in cell wall biosynthesis
VTGRKRIVWLIDGLGMGGAERLMIPIMRHLDTTRFEPRVCALQVKEGNPVAGELRGMGIPVDLLPVRRLRDLTALPRLVLYLRRHRADLVHTQLEFSNTLGSLAARLLRLPAVCTLHTLDAPQRGSKTYRRLRVMWWSLRIFSDRVIAVSEGARRSHLLVSGDSPDRVITLYNGIDLSRFPGPDDAPRSQIRQELGIPPDAPLLITVAVLRPPKGIQYLVEALPAILEAVPGAYYLVVGDGEHRPALEALAASRSVAERVIFAGMRRDVPRLLAAADVFVLPTLTEALPTVVAEAMAARKPVIASAVGGVPEMVADRHSGLLLPPADVPALAGACIDLLSHPDRARAMGEAGRQIAEERFDILTQTRRLGDLYGQLLESYGR